jgi:hypothetical protein
MFHTRAEAQAKIPEWPCKNKKQTVFPFETQTEDGHDKRRCLNGTETGLGIVIHATCIRKALGSIPGVPILMDFRDFF